MGCDTQLSLGEIVGVEMSGRECPGGKEFLGEISGGFSKGEVVWGEYLGKFSGVRSVWGNSWQRNVQIAVQDYKLLCAVVRICDTLVNTQTDMQAHRLWLYQ